MYLELFIILRFQKLGRILLKLFDCYTWAFVEIVLRFYGKFTASLLCLQTSINLHGFDILAGVSFD